MGNIIKNYYDHSQSHDIEVNTDLSVDKILELQRHSAMMADAEEVKENDVILSNQDIKDNSEDIIIKLIPIFYGSRDNATNFLTEIKTMKPTQICNKVRTLVVQKVISNMSYKKDLWQILHDYNLYNPTLRNWTKQV